MANPRKFSEKIALHNQKQAEETAAFEQIMKEVMGATRDIRPQTPASPQLTEFLDPRLHAHGAYQKHHLHINQSLGTFRAGSLPNVNQIGNNSIDLQSALNNLEDIKQGRDNFTERHLRGERGRHAVPHRNRHFLLEKRIDVSPYGSTSYLSPPLDTSWRRTNSDSALHQSAMAAGSPQDNVFISANSPPAQRKGYSMGIPTHDSLDHCTMLLMDTGQHVKEYWDPKKEEEELQNALLINSRPKSCGAPSANTLSHLRLYPLPPDDPGGGHMGGGNSLFHLGINNNTGSLPDLSNLHFPPPLTTPLDSEVDPLSSSPSSYPQHRADTLSPPNTHIIGQPSGGGIPSQSGSPTSPHHLNHHHQQQHMNHQAPHHHQQQHHSPHCQQVCGLLHNRHHSRSKEPPLITVEGLALDTNALSLDPYPPNQGYGVYTQQAQSPTRHQNFGPPSPSLPQVPAGSYRSTTPSDHSCSAPTSPVSHSLSPISSPGLGPTSQLSKSPFTDSVYSSYLQQHQTPPQQQQQHSPQQTTSALQHQLEQFKMVADQDHEVFLDLLPDVNPVCTTSSSPTTPPSPGVFLTGLGDIGGGCGPPPPLRVNTRGGMVPSLISSCGQENTLDSVYYSIAYSSVPDALVQSPTFYAKTGGVISSHQTTPQTPQTPTSIPDIILTAPDAIRQDFAKDLGSAMASMSESFDSDFFPNTTGLDSIEFVGLLGDSDLSVADDTFSLDRS